MKKIISTVFLLVALVVSAFAQSPIKFGVDGGMNLSNNSAGDENKKMKIGFQLGFVAEYEFRSNFFVQSGLSFTTKGVKYEVHLDGLDQESTWNQMYLQVPFYAAYKLVIGQDTKLVFNLGPYFAYGVGGKIKDKYSSSGANGSESKKSTFGSDVLKRFDFGLGAGVGVEFGSYFTGVKYELGLINIERDGAFVTANRNLSLTVGYRF